VTEIWGCVPHGDWEISRDGATDEESVVDGVMQRRVLLRDRCEYLLYKLTHVKQDLPVWWKLILIIADAPTKAQLELECTSEFARGLTNTLL